MADEESDSKESNGSVEDVGNYVKTEENIMGEEEEM
jgi:hypothetical protein